MAKEIIYIQPINNSYWECNEPFGLVKRYIQLYKDGVRVEHARCTFDSHQEWLDGVENIKGIASIINSCSLRTESLSCTERRLFDSPNIQNTLKALSGWKMFVKQKYPNLKIQSFHEWPEFNCYVEFGGERFLCSMALLNFSNRELEIHGHNRLLYKFSISYDELLLIRKLLRVDFLTSLESLSRMVSFSPKANLSDYIKSGFLL